MGKKGLLASAVVVAALTAGSPPAVARSAPCADTSGRADTGRADEMRSAILCLHNRERERMRVRPLRPNPSLRRAA